MQNPPFKELFYSRDIFRVVSQRGHDVGGHIHLGHIQLGKVACNRTLMRMMTILMKVITPDGGDCDDVHDAVTVTVAKVVQLWLCLSGGTGLPGDLFHINHFQTGLKSNLSISSLWTIFLLPCRSEECLQYILLQFKISFQETLSFFTENVQSWKKFNLLKSW